VAASLSLLAQVPNPGSEGKIQLPWLKDYAEALKKAEAEKKPILIDITTDWCGWSKKMERETFADPAVQKELRSFVLVRFNPEASDKNQQLADSYGVDGYPTLIVANFRGEQIGETSGFSDAKDLLAFLRRFLPSFKGNPLGYKSVHLDATDPLLKAIQRIPAPESRPSSVGSFVVLDQCDIKLQANGTAKFVSRTATFIADPEKGDVPHAARHYVSSRQKLKFRTVRILDTKGVGREVDVNLAKDEHAYSNQNVYWDVRSLALDLPTLKEGQILDVIEELETQPVMTNQFYFRWNTGARILLASDLTITFPSSLNLQKRAIRCAGEVKETRNPNGTITWELKTSSPKPYEPVMFSPPLYEISEGYDFYTPSSKDAVAQWFAGLCQGRDVLPGPAKQRIADLKKAHDNQAALLQAILDWVNKDIRYVSVAFGASSHQPHPVGDTLGYLYGDCKDQSLLVQALCREAGIPASLVLLDAYGQGFDETCPAVDRFNHCIVEATAGGRAYYLDPAQGPSKLGHVPSTYAGIKALKLQGPTGQTVTLPPYEPAKDQQSSQTIVKLNPNGGATITEISLLGGPAAAEAKERMKKMPPAKLRKYLEDSYKKTGRKLVDFFMTDTNAPGDKFESRIAYTVPRFGSMTAGGLVFKLGAQAREEEWIEALNLPRTQAFRFTPTDSAQVTFTVELPAGSVLKSQPQDLQVDTPFMKATRKLSFKDNKLSVAETTRLLDARLAANEASKVYAAFRKLHEHRDYAFIVEMPSPPAATGQ
jgi:thioredoxin-related protein